MTDVAAVGSLPMYNGWANYSGLSNLYDTDLMGSSIFNGYMMPFMPGGGINYDKYFNQMNDYLNFTSDYSLNMVENQRRNELRLNAADESIRNAAAILNEKIADNEQQQIMLAYRAYLEAVAAKYPGESERNIIARAKTDYQRLYNTSISDDIRKYGHNSFTHGLFNGLTFGLIILFLAYTLKLAFDDSIKHINVKNILLWSIIFAYICILKYAYFPFIVAYFLIPYKKFESRKAYFKYFWLSACASLVLIFIFLSAVMSTPVLNQHTKTFLINDKADLIKQIITAPVDYLKKVLISTYILRGFIYRNIISSVSVFFKMIPVFAVNIAYIALLLSVFYKTVNEKIQKISLKQKGLIAAGIIISYLIIVTSVYLIFKSKTYIVGIQGRYLTPLLLFALLAFASDKFCFKSKIVPVFLFLVSQFLLLCTFVNIINMYA